MSIPVAVSSECTEVDEVHAHTGTDTDTLTHSHSLVSASIGACVEEEERRRRRRRRRRRIYSYSNDTIVGGWAPAIGATWRQKRPTIEAKETRYRGKRYPL
jgi:hypothetical protein